MGDELPSILIVDDNRMNRMKMRRALDTDEFLIAEAPGGREALTILAEQEFDIVLLDILMPEVDGHAVLSRMRHDDRLGRTSVIMVSALDEDDAVQKCLAAGAIDYLIKPIDSDILKSRVRGALHARKPAESGEHPQ